MSCIACYSRSFTFSQTPSLRCHFCTIFQLHSRNELKIRAKPVVDCYSVPCIAIFCDAFLSSILLVFKSYVPLLSKLRCFMHWLQLLRCQKMLPQQIFKNHKIFEKKTQDLDSKSQVFKIKLLLTLYAKLKSVITSESTVMTFELHRLS